MEHMQHLSAILRVV